jgi:hypothetical protein
MRAFAVQSFGEAPAIQDLPIPTANGALLIRVKRRAHGRVSTFSAGEMGSGASLHGTNPKSPMSALGHVWTYMDSARLQRLTRSGATVTTADVYPAS